MSAETPISLEEYLNTSYDPDVEYVDGVLVERNVGQRGAIATIGEPCLELTRAGIFQDLE